MLEMLDLALVGRPGQPRRRDPSRRAVLGRFHLDVADGQYVPTLLFFPDLVRALRLHTAVPFEVHLMVTDPLAWVDPFADAGRRRGDLLPRLRRGARAW